jgi:hypothetical protein
MFVAIAINTAVSGAGGASELTANSSAHFRLNFFLAALFGLIWGALRGWLGALLTPRLPTFVIASVRTRVDRTRQLEPGPR